MRSAISSTAQRALATPLNDRAHEEERARPLAEPPLPPLPPPLSTPLSIKQARAMFTARARAICG